MELIETGFQKTEAGKIPEDWNVIKVGDAVQEGYLEKPLDGNHGNIHPKKSDFVSSGIPFIMANNVSNGIVDVYSCAFITEEQANSLQKGFAIKDDVLLTHKGTVGNVALVGEISTPYIMLTPQVTYYRVNKDKIDNRYLKSYFESIPFQRIINSLSGGGTRAYIGIVKQRKLPLVIPPTLKEQKAIANALSGVDALIHSLEALIAKKKAIKQGAMQELLTGKTRLAGFENNKGYKQTEVGLIPVDWEVVPFIELSTMKGRIGWQGLKKDEFTMISSDPFLITGMNFKDGEIRWNEVYHVSYDRYQIAKEIQLKEGDVLMTKDGTIGKLLYVSKIPSPGLATLNSHLLLFRPIRKSYVPKYLYYHLHTNYFKSFIDDNKSGSTFFGISQESIGKYKIIVPPYEEQKAIANVLSDIDKNIQELEEKKNKYQAIKQGMMQELLMGKTRLI